MDNLNAVIFLEVVLYPNDVSIPIKEHLLGLAWPSSLVDPTQDLLLSATECVPVMVPMSKANQLLHKKPT